ncbi:MAG: single-stranded DNA-binding protein [Steroidobacteraceae bacterium]
MNSFTLRAVGALGRNPERISKGDTHYTRFQLVGDDYAGRDGDGQVREVVTSLWLVAFGALGEALCQNARTGDQLIVEAALRPDNWTEKTANQHPDPGFVLTGFRFGAPGWARQGELEDRAAYPSNSKE